MRSPLGVRGRARHVIEAGNSGGMDSWALRGPTVPGDPIIRAPNQWFGIAYDDGSGESWMIRIEQGGDAHWYKSDPPGSPLEKREGPPDAAKFGAFDTWSELMVGDDHWSEAIGRLLLGQSLPDHWFAWADCRVSIGATWAAAAGDALDIYGEENDPEWAYDNTLTNVMWDDNENWPDPPRKIHEFLHPSKLVIQRQYDDWDGVCPEHHVVPPA